MDALDLARERDALLELGRTVEEVARMRRNADGETERLLAAWAERAERPWPDHACVECIAESADRVPWAPEGWLCLWHRGRALLALSRLETPTGASAHHPEGGT